MMLCLFQKTKKRLSYSSVNLPLNQTGDVSIGFSVAFLSFICFSSFYAVEEKRGQQESKQSRLLLRQTRKVTHPSSSSGS